MAQDSIVGGLFGLTPEMYQRSQQAADQQEARQFAQLSPFEQASAGFYSAGRGLGRGIGSMLGAEDPQLRMIAQQQQILSNVDFSDPISIMDAAKNAQIGGNFQLFFKLQELLEPAKKLQEQQQVKNIVRQAYSISPETVAGQPASNIPAVDDEGNALRSALPDYSPQQIKFDISKVAPLLMASEEGRKQLSSLLAAEKAMRPEIKEVAKGTKLLQRNPTTGNFEPVAISGQMQAQTIGENPIQALLDGGAVEQTIIPLAQQFARSFPRLDPDEQDKLVEKLTAANTSAQNARLNREDKFVQMRATNANMALSAELTRLRINDAKQKAEEAKDGKQVPVNLLEKLSKQSDGVEQASSLYNTFKDEYVGYKLDTVGKADIALALRSDDPSRLDLGNWWQSYQERTNKIRNDLFGAALTAQEKAEFDKAMVTPGMSPKSARSNLLKQAEAAQKAYSKITNAAKISGYSKSAIDSLNPTIQMTEEKTPTTSDKLPPGVSVKPK